MQYPSVSVIIATFNSGRTLAACLASIRSQDYPQKKVEIILVDGGSTDNTVAIGTAYKTRIIKKKGMGPEAAKSVGLSRARGEIVADFGSDNYLPDKHFFTLLVRPLAENQSIAGSYPLYYTYRPDDTIFNRYVALFGVNDPVPLYLGKADRQSVLYSGYALSGDAIKRKGYFEIHFSQDNLPTVGANGFFIRREILQKAQTGPSRYFHIDVVHDIVGKGHDTFAVVYTSIIHDTADTLLSLLRKRRIYFRQLYLKKKKARRYHIVNTKKFSDIWKIGLFIIFSVTFVQPLLLSIRGFVKKRDMAWFVHPLFCFLIVLIYAEAILFDFKASGSGSKP